jgi:hypothetical protein
MKKENYIVMRNDSEKIGFTIRRRKDVSANVGKMASILCIKVGSMGGSIPSKKKGEFINLIIKYLDQ